MSFQFPAKMTADQLASRGAAMTDLASAVKGFEGVFGRDLVVSVVRPGTGMMLLEDQPDMRVLGDGPDTTGAGEWA